MVAVNERVKKGELLADGHSVSDGELALGKNVLVAYMSWHGFGYEDSIVISDRLLRDDTFTSLHINNFEIDELETHLGKEMVTRDVPGVGHQALAHLDDDGIVKVGALVKPGDILVGKVTPKGEDPSPEEALLRALFGNTISQVKDASLTVPPGAGGVVVDVHILERRRGRSQKNGAPEKERRLVRKERDEELEIARRTLCKALRKLTTKHSDLIVSPENAIFDGELKKLTANGLTGLSVSPDSKAPSRIKEKTSQMLLDYRDQVTAIGAKYIERKTEISRGDELPDDVIRRVIVTVAQKKKIEVGDKTAGRYGNKGIVSKIVPLEDMPYKEDGTPIDVILNPLGVPSRMNIGQLLETQFGMASWKLGQKVSLMAEDGSTTEELRSILKEIYVFEKQQKDIDAMSAGELKGVAKRLEGGIPVATPVFAGAKERDINDMLQKAGLSAGTYRLYDGRTGEPFDRDILVGKQYIMKLHHLVEDKIHARSVGPYCIITQQPLKSRANLGGQRVGEMEVWALEGYGAAYNLLEMTTIKSDDIEGRAEVFDEIRRKGRYHLGGARTEALNVLLKELQGLCLDVEFINKSKKAAIESSKSKQQKQ
jgi:DNA-directed RNA polymerase subunit beta